MASENKLESPSKGMWWTGCVLSGLVVALMLFSVSFTLFKPALVEEQMAKGGWPAGIAIPLGIVELGCTVLYVIPQTAVLGAVLLTGYLGGAVATHVRASENFLIPAAAGVVVWLGLFLREPRLRALLPWRK
jgi:energy-converting hydrogenase Eha subunit A